MEGEVMTIIVDSNEPLEMVTLLKKEGVRVLRQRLELGDYVIKDIYLERKHFGPNRNTGHSDSGDLFSSVKNNRLWTQLSGLSQHEKGKVGVILEGIPPAKEDEYAFNKYWGIYYGIVFGWKMPVIKTNSPKETAKALKRLWEKLDKPRPFVRPIKKRSLTPEEIRSDILCCAKGLGRYQAKLLLKEYGTVDRVIHTPTEELIRIKGIRESAINNMKRDFTT